MGNDSDNSLDALKSVLSHLNEAVFDWEASPAEHANSQGVTGDFPLHKIAIWGDTRSAEVLIAHGANVDALGEDGDTPLHRAVAGGHAEMVKVLLRRGANPDIRNRYGRSSRDDAKDSSNIEVKTAMSAI